VFEPWFERGIRRYIFGSIDLMNKSEEIPKNAIGVWQIVMRGKIEQDAIFTLWLGLQQSL
jgi:hypothetical protein